MLAGAVLVVTEPADGDLRAAAEALLQRLLVEVTGDRQPVVRRCPRCGGPHGRPELPGLPLHASLSRTPGRVAAAVSGAGPVGVDVETVERTGFDGFAAVALAPGERAADLPARARAWTRKEAVLKAAGTGLRVDPRTVDVRDDRLVDPWPARLVDVPVPAGTACAAAVLTDGPVRWVL